MDAIASLTAAVPGDPLEALARPPEGVAAVEVRVDLLPSLDPATAVATCPLPLLLTYRSTSEGGQGSNDPSERRRVITRAHESGAALLDLEMDRDAPLLAELGLDRERVVLSWHDPTRTPESLAKKAAEMLATGVRWAKVIPTTHSLRDLAAVLRLHGTFNRDKPEKRRLITFGMGSAGLPSRFLAPLVGPELTYVAWNEGAAAAPAQLTLAEMQAVIGHLSGPPRRIYGVVGQDAHRSLSPRLHGAAYRALDLPYVFLPISAPVAEELSSLFRPRGEGILDMPGAEVFGLAVTTPYKEVAVRAASVVAPRARRARSANTLLFKERQILADTTDADGVVGSLVAAGMDPQGVTVVVQGTGGAARAAAIGLDLAGAQVFLRGRDPERTRRVAEELALRYSKPGKVPERTGILVNATPLGLAAGDPSPFSPEEVSRAEAVVDMVYGNGISELARLSRAAAARYISGREILFFQGVVQFLAMTGRQPPREVMRRAISIPPAS